MSEERNFGVTEAGLGLTVITCLLVALGYWIVQKLDGTGEAPPVEVRLGQESAVTPAAPPEPPGETLQQPRVLIAEEAAAAPSELPHTAHRPEWLAPQDEAAIEQAPEFDSPQSPLSSDAAESAWPAAESDPAAERSWHEPMQVR